MQLIKNYNVYYSE